MESLIPVINQLQDVLNAVGSDEIDLPQIVVVGSQSSGKSSVLEALVGRDFLPRGSGIVTRRPLVLQLHNIPTSQVEGSHANGNGSLGDAEEGVGTNDKEWGEFLHLRRKKFFDFSEIRTEIERETERAAGKNKGVIAQPITLKVYSPHVLNLTLVDLPGITKVPVGDQPSDIEAQIRDMVLSYITKPSAIILAVTAANTDLANSDALQMAKRVDPQGDRTIGVLTKLDLMDKGTNALEVLQGKLLPLKLGYIAVMNRSQQDIITGKSMSSALKDESKYFDEHPIYSSLQGQCGTRFLGTTLNKTLMLHIKSKIPELRAKISKSLEEATKQLASYPPVPSGAQQSALVLDLINKFHSGYKESIEGKISKDEGRVVTELSGGARINFVFNEVFVPELLRIDPLEGLTPMEIRFAIRNATGPRNALFIPETAFELLVKRQITRLEHPALLCVDHVFAELQRIAASLEGVELTRFEKLRREVMSAADSFLHSCRAPCKQMITDLLAIENAYINTSHPDFQSAINAIRAQTDSQGKPNNALGSSLLASSSAPASGNPFPTPSERAAATTSTTGKPRPAPSSTQPVSQATTSAAPAPSSSHRAPPQTMAQLMAKATFGEGVMNEREETEVKWVQQLLVSYFAIVRLNIQDAVPKTVMNLLVNESKKMDKALIVKLIGSEAPIGLLDESPETAERRNACEKTVDILQKAKNILSSVNHAVA